MKEFKISNNKRRLDYISYNKTTDGVFFYYIRYMQKRVNKIFDKRRDRRVWTYKTIGYRNSNSQRSIYDKYLICERYVWGIRNYGNPNPNLRYYRAHNMNKTLKSIIK